MLALGPIAAYEQAVRDMEAAGEARDAARKAAEARNPHFGCCGTPPLPEDIAFLKACAARDDARRNLPIDAEDICDRPFLSKPAPGAPLPPPPQYIAIAD